MLQLNDKENQSESNFFSCLIVKEKYLNHLEYGNKSV